MNLSQFAETDAQWWQYLAARHNAYARGVRLRREANQSQAEQTAAILGQTG